MYLLDPLVVEQFKRHIPLLMIVGTREIVSYGEEMEKTSRQHKTKIAEQNVLILLFRVLEIKYANINAQAF